MKSQLTRGTATASLLIMVFATSFVMAQDPATRTSSNNNQQEAGMDKIGEAYRTLHSATLSTLQDKARNWPKNPSTSTTDPSGRTTTGISGGTEQIRSQELLIAACPSGLFAGAPTGTALSQSGTKLHGDRDTDPTDPSSNREGDRDREGSSLNPTEKSRGMMAEQQVGMFLVSSNSSRTSTTSSTGTSSGTSTNDRESEGSENKIGSSAFTTNKPLNPGIYCVKMTGNSVWLTDEAGSVVLRTTVEAPGSKSLSNTGSTSSSSEAARERDRIRAGEERPAGTTSTERDRTSSTGTSYNKEELNWECVFGAITMEAMKSSGWNKN